jgi:protein-S-isoprenylcysteine O-methyltransferase Ste14
MTTIEIIVLGVITICITWFSWQVSLKEKRYHGIARFFSFESIVIIVMLNYRVWFVNAFSLLQLCSWLFLILSIVFALTGFSLLSRHGKAKGNFENTTQLIQSGIYHYIRHPLYLSLILLGTGAMLKQPGLLQWILMIINFLAMYITARIEENEMIIRFGDEYREYMKRSKMFIPFII